MWEEIRQWTMNVCVACVWGALFMMLFPKSSTAKLLRMIVSMMVLCVICQPLRHAGQWFQVLSQSPFSLASFENPALENEVESNASRIYAAYLEENLRRVLDDSHISYQRMEVTMDNSDDRRISIGQVEVIVKEQDAVQAESIKRLLLPYIGQEPKVTVEQQAP